MNPLLACALALLHHDPIADACKGQPIPHEMYSTINAVRSAVVQFPAVSGELVLKVIYTESRFKVHARGQFGEVGLMQVKRGGAVPAEFARLPDLYLEDVGFNVYLGVAYMAKMRAQCAALGLRGPSYWLSRYNGGTCRISGYSQHVQSQEPTIQRYSHHVQGRS